MTIRLQLDPAGSRDLVNLRLSQRLHRSRHLLALRGSPEVGAGFPAYVITLDGASKEDPLSEAKLMGWQYPIVGGDVAGLAHLAVAPEGLEYSGVSHGIMPQRLLEASAVADHELGQREAQFQPRLLEIPALRIYALWLYGSSNYFILLMEGNPPGSSALQLITDIRPRIIAALAARRPRSLSPGTSPSN